MEGGENCGKRASLEMKSEPEEVEVAMQDESEGGGPLVAAEAMKPAQIDVTMGVTLLHCQGCLGFSLSHRWHVLVGEEDRSVFLVSLGPLGEATAVSLVSVRPDGAAEASPKFWCKLSVERAGYKKDNLVLMASAVSSSALSIGAPAPGQGMFLAVPQELLSGDTLTLSVRIDLIQPAAVAAPPKSTIPRARAPRRMQ